MFVALVEAAEAEPEVELLSLRARVHPDDLAEFRCSLLVKRIKLIPSERRRRLLWDARE